MRYVYVLGCANNTLYIGTTNDLKRRVSAHSVGKVVSTKKKLPIQLLFYEAFINERDAWNREKYLKSGWGRRHLKTMLADTLKI